MQGEICIDWKYYYSFADKCIAKNPMLCHHTAGADVL